MLGLLRAIKNVPLRTLPTPSFLSLASRSWSYFANHYLAVSVRVSRRLEGRKAGFESQAMLLRRYLPASMLSLDPSRLLELLRSDLPSRGQPDAKTGNRSSDRSTSINLARGSYHSGASRSMGLLLLSKEGTGVRIPWLEKSRGNRCLLYLVRLCPRLWYYSFARTASRCYFTSSILVGATRNWNLALKPGGLATRKGVYISTFCPCGLGS